MTTLRFWMLLGLGALVSAAASRAQAPPDTVLFETVGDAPMDMRDIAFGPDGMLWGSNIDLWNIPPSGTAWNEVNDYPSISDLLPLSADTLLAGFSLAVVVSYDRGENWEGRHHSGGALFATALDGPNRGLLLGGTQYDDEDDPTGFAYSTDRGATWTDAEVITGTTRHPEAFAFAEIPDGPNRGRLIGGAMNGLFLSDDGGKTWTESSLVENMRYIVDSVVLGADGRVWASVQDGAVPGGQAFVSADDGATWAHAATFPYPVLLAAVPGPPQGDGGLYAQQTAVPLSGELMDLYRSYDGETWTPVGRVPGPTAVRVVRDVEISPDGRLYITLTLAGSASEWVYRTTEPIVVSNEPYPLLPLPEATLRVYPNPARDRLTITGSSGTEAVVYDVLGRIVRRARLAGHTVEVDVAGLAPGVYVVRAKSQSAVVTVRR